MLETRTAWQKATDFIPNGTQTLSKSPERFVNGVYPKMLSYGRGSKVYDCDNNEYIDFIAGLGPIILGYNHPFIDGAVIKTINFGQVCLSLPHERESELAELLWETIPCAQKAKFFKTGSEALSAAVRACRTLTGKDKIAVCGYHGWHDWYVVANERKAGIPKVLNLFIEKFKYNDIESLENILKMGGVGAVIMEPVVYEEPNDFLQQVIDSAHRHDALVVFDEVVSGYRFGIGGASDYFNVKSDLVCLSKALGNGYPIAVLAGQRKFMDVFERDDFFVSGTFGGDLIGITAAMAVIDCLDKEHVIETLWERGDQLKLGFNSICKTLGIEETSCIGYPPRTCFNFPSKAHKALFWQECLKAGILFGHANFIMTAHSKADIDAALNASLNAMRVVKAHWGRPESKLEGDMPVDVFKS